MLTGVLVATVRDPSRSGPGAKLHSGLKCQGDVGVADNPPPFSRRRWRPATDIGTTQKIGRSQLGSRGGAVFVDESAESVSALDEGRGGVWDLQLPSRRFGRLEIE
jgi:hypothetical protein